VRVNGDHGTVFVVNDNVLERRVVRLGTRTSAGQVVLSGLTAGSQVVVGNLDALGDGAKVRVGSTGKDRQGVMP
jgi:hypothetical protein